MSSALLGWVMDVMDLAGMARNGPLVGIVISKVFLLQNREYMHNDEIPSRRCRYSRRLCDIGSKKAWIRRIHMCGISCIMSNGGKSHRIIIRIVGDQISTAPFQILPLSQTGRRSYALVRLIRAGADKHDWALCISHLIVQSSHEFGVWCPHLTSVM